MATAAKEVKKDAKKPAKPKGDGSALAAYNAKRKAKRLELQKADPLKFNLILNFKEAKEFGVIKSELVDGLSTWEQFCEMKKTATSQYWENAKKSKVTSQKGVEKKKLKKAKMLEILAKLDKELGEETPGLADAIAASKTETAAA